MLISVLLCPVFLVKVLVKRLNSKRKSSKKGMTWHLLWQKLKAWLTEKFLLLYRSMKLFFILVGIAGKRMGQWVLSLLPYTPHSIQTMKLFEYERMCNGEYKLAIRKGYASKAQIAENVANITNDFSVACENVFYRQYLDLECNIANIKIRIASLEYAKITILRQYDKAADVLRSLSLQVFNDVERDIKTINSNLKLEKNKLRWANEEFDTLRKRVGGENRKIDYYDILINIQMGLQLGFRITTDITLAEYAAYLKQLEKIIEKNGKSIEQFKHKK